MSDRLRNVLISGCLFLFGQTLASADTITPIQREFIKNHPAWPLYQQYCAGCHGEFLQGGSASSFLDDEWVYGSSDKELTNSISRGLDDAGMPNFAPTFNDEQLAEMIDLMRNAHRGKSDLVKNLRVPKESEARRGSRSKEDRWKTRDYEIVMDVVVDKGLKHPWSIDFLDSKTALVTEKSGQLRWLVNGKLDPKPITGIPDVRDRGQGGLMDVVFDPDYGDGKNDWVYLAFTDFRDGKKLGMTKLVRGKIEKHRWTQEEVIFQPREEDYFGGGVHFGCRIVFDKAKRLYFAIGDRGRRNDAQRLDKPNGKVHRINRDGSIPSSNPYINAKSDRGEVYPSIFSIGHRNIQGMAIHPETDQLWTTEHGPRGGDELNLTEAGKNYGWPIITYGINYNGTIITDEYQRDGLEQPELFWIPSIAVCGLDMYWGGPCERWRGNLLAGGLAGKVVERLALDGDKVMHREIILKDKGRVRDVCAGPDGNIYVVLNRPDRIVRLRSVGRSSFSTPRKD